MTFFNFDANDIASTTSYIGDVFSSVKPLFFLLVGLILGLWVLGEIVKIFNNQQK